VRHEGSSDSRQIRTFYLRQSRTFHHPQDGHSQGEGLDNGPLARPDGPRSRKRCRAPLPKE